MEGVETRTKFDYLLKRIGLNLLPEVVEEMGRKYIVPIRVHRHGGVILLQQMKEKGKFSADRINKLRGILEMHQVGHLTDLIDSFELENACTTSKKLRMNESLRGSDESAPPKVDLRKMASFDFANIRQLPKIKWLLLTESIEETRAVLTVFSGGRAVREHKSGQDVFYIFPRQYTALLRCPQGERKTSSLVGSAIKILKPAYIVSVGVAFGKGGRQMLGDILLSEQIIEFDQARVEKGVKNAERDARGILCSHEILSLFMLERSHFKPTPRGKRGDLVKNNVHIGSILSGGSYNGRQRFKEKLYGLWPYAVGSCGEEEGTRATAVNSNSECCRGYIAVKGICDWADGRKMKKWLPYAARVAAEFVHYVVNQNKEEEKVKEKPRGGPSDKKRDSHLHDTSSGQVILGFIGPYGRIIKYEAL